MEITIFYRLALALGIGLIIGLQRENSYQNTEEFHPIGVRTFALSGLLGGVLAFLSSILNSTHPILLGFTIVSVLLLASYTIHHHTKKTKKIGLTTSFSMLLVYLLGVLCWYNRLLESCAIMVALLAVLSFKEQLHVFAQKISKEDIFATIKFAVMAALVLPFLPNKAYGPENLEVFNPFVIGLFVVILSGISFIGYILVKLIGPGKEIGVTGILGGIASSTALTLNFTQKSKSNPKHAATLSMGIILSWSMMYVRLYIMCVAIHPNLLVPLIIPMFLPMIPGFLYAFYLKYKESKIHNLDSNFKNPFELTPALQFGLIFVFVLFLTNLAQSYFGNSGLLISSFFAGFAAIDAIALSVISMQKTGVLGINQVVLAILFAGLANTFLKGGMVVLFGAKTMRKVIIPVTLSTIAISLGLIFIYY